MSKLHFDYDGINNEVIPSINNTITKLDNALYIANNIIPPSDIALASILSTAKADIKKNKDELYKIKDWLERSSKIYKKRIESIEESLGRIEVEKLIKKEDWIKEITHEE